MKKIFYVIGVCLILFNTAHAAKIYKWRDPDGQVHYSTTPPPDADAKSTPISTREQPVKEKVDNEVNLEGLSDEEKIRVLQEKLNKEKIRALEEELKAIKQGKAVTGIDEQKETVDTDENALPEEETKPDYSVQGQVRMLEEAKRIEAMKTRCRAKARHGIDCSRPENYEQY
ncbi:MAG: DUF4124 domain-containing protein [Desulfobacterales bacterium]|nr:MAG: DUF4124 domain-containing protein [Desulfobacterales bacterium]